MSGLVSYLSGKSAEDAVMQAYVREGHRLLARRWRGPAGEIDLVMEKAGQIVFVEVKRSRNFLRAAESLGKRQIGRLLHSAEHCLSFFPAQSRTEARFDVALVNGIGDIKVVPNALMH